MARKTFFSLMGVAPNQTVLFSYRSNQENELSTAHHTNISQALRKSLTFAR